MTQFMALCHVKLKLLFFLNLFLKNMSFTTLCTWFKQDKFIYLLHKSSKKATLALVEPDLTFLNVEYLVSPSLTCSS